ncbi:unnamed protein product [Pelagomonas calceolata]|uniref:Uncharacterized protein n=1 Tax=Pelagomonas calceolata TaxID=35677 RepID=A0A8J2SBC4_9STRA|nr:unnamed protein product [Pelagomonas calceolata]
MRNKRVCPQVKSDSPSDPFASLLSLFASTPRKPPCASASQTRPRRARDRFLSGGVGAAPQVSMPCRKSTSRDQAGPSRLLRVKSTRPRTVRKARDHP